MPRNPMPKTARARRLLRLLETGPEFHLEPAWTPKALELYKLWADSWIIPEIKELIPELVEAEKKGRR